MKQTDLFSFDISKSRHPNTQHYKLLKKLKWHWRINGSDMGPAPASESKKWTEGWGGGPAKSQWHNSRNPWWAAVTAGLLLAMDSLVTWVKPWNATAFVSRQGMEGIRFCGCSIATHLSALEECPLGLLWVPQSTTINGRKRCQFHSSSSALLALPFSL